MSRSPMVLVVLVLGLALPLSSQALPHRVAAAGNGIVTFAYATRAGVCGNGHVIVIDDPAGRDGPLVYSGDGISTGAWGVMVDGRRCDTGPARVRLTLRDRRVLALRPLVGDGAPGHTDKDLGIAAALDAANYFLDLAASDPSLARDAMLAATIADSARIAPRLTTISRDRSLHHGIREEALRWLGRTAIRDDYLAEAERALQDIARDSTDVIVVRDRAIRVVGHTAGSDAFLRSLYTRLTEPALRDRVLRALGAEPTNETLTWIESIVLNENETVALRERALRVLAEEHGDPARVRALYPKLHHDALKERAARLVGAAGDAASERWLLALVQDANEPVPVRDRAIRLLGESGNYTQLRDLYGRTQESSLKDRIIRVLGEAGGTDNLRFVRGIVVSSSESAGARDRALRMLAQSGLSTADLTALYDSLPDRTLRTRLIQILAERGGDAAFEKLTRIARDDPDADLRRQAARRLAQSGDPRAQAFFERTLKN